MQTLVEDEDTEGVGTLNFSRMHDFLFPSSGLSVRHKRAASLKASGCVLFMCTYHELLYRLHHIYNKQKAKTAPESKIRSTGYGRRRRRSVEDDTETLLQSETGEQDSEEALPLCGYNICTAAAA